MSSVLIKGMEMPKPGRYEAVIIVLDKSTAEIAISPEEDVIDYWKEYPLIPVPPHGRLTDADAFIKKCEEMADKEDGNQLDALVLLRWFLEQNAPTIIEAEESE